MSMEIGGIDLLLTEVPRRTFDVRVILAELAAAWPQSVIQGAGDDSTRPVADALKSDQPLNGDDEFFVFRTPAGAASWDRFGATAKNANDMINFLMQTVRNGRSIGITMVIGKMNPEMARLYWTVDHALVQAGKKTNVVSRAEGGADFAAELRAVGRSLNPMRLGGLAEKLLAALFPDWTIEELACHPHDAIQFCEVVRTKAGAPIPDHLIMRLLLNRRERTFPKNP